jgi:5,10-methylene-tetrahydrofolate dehydrogenase/methenyl tetrahydrofolate cyclohydrolase
MRNSVQQQLLVRLTCGQPLTQQALLTAQRLAAESVGFTAEQWNHEETRSQRQATNGNHHSWFR